jgi:hypothetical protein
MESGRVSLFLEFWLLWDESWVVLFDMGLVGCLWMGLG